MDRSKDNIWCLHTFGSGWQWLGTGCLSVSHSERKPPAVTKKEAWWVKRNALGWHGQAAMS